jgi:hypothetical protein
VLATSGGWEEGGGGRGGQRVGVLGPAFSSELFHAL